MPNPTTMMYVKLMLTCSFMAAVCVVMLIPPIMEVINGETTRSTVIQLKVRFPMALLFTILPIVILFIASWK